MTKGLKMKKMGSAELLDTMATVSSASEARFGTFWRNHFVLFQDLLSLFQAVFTLWHVHNRALDTNGEAFLPVLMFKN